MNVNMYLHTRAHTHTHDFNPTKNEHLDSAASGVPCYDFIDYFSDFLEHFIALIGSIIHCWVLG